MTTPKHARPDREPARARSTERGHLAELAAALSPYGVWARVLEDGSPRLRVSNPNSRYAVEDIDCERHAYRHVFTASFGVRLGTSDDLGATAHRVAWLVGLATHEARPAHHG